MIRAVVDTNTVLSSLISEGGNPARILWHWRQGSFTLVLSETILAEMADVLTRPAITKKHKRSPAQIQARLRGFRQFGLVVEPAEALQVVDEDPDDDMLFEAAVAGQAHFIVSGDARVQAVKEYQGIVVLSPAAFVVLLEGGGDV